MDDTRLQQIDETLKRLDGAVRVMTANLMDLEGNATRQMLDPAALAGTTAVRAEQALATMAWLWSQFLRIKEVVEKAGELRGNRRRPDSQRLAELDHLVLGPSIALPPLVVPLAHRGLLTPGETPAAIAPTELLATMEDAFDAARSDIFAIEAAWTVKIPRLERASDDLRALEKTAAAVGEADDPSLAAAGQMLRSVVEVMTTDPLGLPAGRVDEAEAALARARTHFDELVGRRDTVATRLAEAERLTAEIAGLLAEGTRARSETMAKIAHPAGLLEPLDSGCLDDERSGLRPWLDRITRMAAAGAWKEATRELEGWTRVAGTTHQAARQVVDANSAPLRRRAELRGRLDALSAKAGSIGLAEDLVLGAVRVQATEVLYAAPCDLDRAAALVATYGAALAGHRAGKPPVQDQQPGGVGP